MSHDTEFCPRSITFTIPLKNGNGVRVTAVERDGNIDFSVEVIGTGAHISDLRGLFFHFDEADLPGLNILHDDGAITATEIGVNSVRNIAPGVNMNGVASPFDIGIAFGTPGKGKDVVNGPVSFTLDAQNDLTLDDIAHVLFGVRTTSTGDKATFLAPAAPKANDDFATTHEDQPVVIDVLGNDTDADLDTLTITAVHLLGDTHGMVEISADGKSIIYTPDKDYAGLNLDPNSADAMFEYCVSDGNGGQDSAIARVHIIPVADKPTVTFEVLAPETNDPINLIRLKVTAAQSDADGSEFINGFAFGGLPAGVTLVTDGDLSTTGEPSSTTEFVQLLLPTGQDVSFDLSVIATSEEKGNGDPDTATVTATKPIEIDFNHTAVRQDFSATNQSIWTTGEAFSFDRDLFIGPDIPFNESLTFLTPTFPPLPVTASAEGHFKLGIDVDIHFTGGAITAHLPFDVTIDTTYNKVTDSLLIHTGAALASGASFSTTGPEGNVDIAFVIDMLAKLSLEDGIAGVIGIEETFSFQPEPLHLIEFDSQSASLPHIVQLPAGMSIALDWPHLSGGSTGQSGNQVLGEASSNNMLQLNLDVDFAAAQLFPLFAPIEAVLDPDPTSEENFELFDLDVFAGANLLQDFVLDFIDLRGQFQFEVGDPMSFTVGGGDILIRNASALDGTDVNDTIDIDFLLTPNATLDNTTSVGLNVGGQLGLFTNIPVIDKSLFDEGLTIPVESIPVYGTDPFALNFNSQTVEFFV